MKNLLKSFTTFTRPERMGIVALLAIMLVLIAVRFTMHLWVSSPEVDVQQVVIATKKLQEENPKFQNTGKVTLPPGTKINLNTADSLTLISLPGIGKGLSHRILERRRQLGKFTNMEQVLDVYKFRQETKEMLLEMTVVE